MVVHLLLFSRYVDNHGHLWSRDFKLTNECVYSSFLLKLLHQIGNTPTQQLEILRTWLNQREPSSNQPGSTGRYLDQIGNKGSHSIYFFIHKRKPKQWHKIKGCKRNKQNTHARQIRMLKQRLSHTKGAYKLQQMSQHGKIKGCLSEYTFPNFLPKTKGAISA